jgi:HipA-like protein
LLTLDVHIESVASPVGKLTRQADGSSRFRYLQDGLPHPVSLGLPIREEPFGDAATRGFFANLLFENAMLDPGDPTSPDRAGGFRRSFVSSWGGVARQSG